MTDNPLDPVAAGRLAEVAKVFTSDLSVAEFTLLHHSGFDPLELVMGTSVFHIGFQPPRGLQSGEFQVLTQAMYTARSNAMGRMQAEADAVDADGVVGVRLIWRQHGVSPEHIEFIAIGTSVRHRENPGAFKRPSGQAFSSHLSGHELYQLMLTGWAPVAFVMGTCVYHVAPQGFMQTLSQIGRNVEMPQWTQAYYEAREAAMTRMQAEAERDQAHGVVGVNVDVSEWVWGAHTLEFYASGTAVRRSGEASPDVPPLTVPLT
jgi:uncharacterized protein YbjQ (UPF0145 family)